MTGITKEQLAVEIEAVEQAMDRAMSRKLYDELKVILDDLNHKLLTLERAE